MKKTLFFIFFILLILSCSDDDPIVFDYRLEKIDKRYNENLTESSDLLYDQSDAVVGINRCIVGYNKSEISILKDEDFVIQIRNKIERENRIDVDLIYEVEYNPLEIILREKTYGGIYTFQHTNEFIDYFQYRSRNNNDYFTEIFFERDSDENILRISHVENNPIDQALLVSEYEYSGYSSSARIPDSYNPVYLNEVIDRQLLLALGLQISKDSPLVSSYWFNGGEKKEDYIKIDIIDRLSDDRASSLSYQIIDRPDEIFSTDLIYVENN